MWSPVDILQDSWEFETLLNLYKAAKPKTVLEIGSLYGGTIYHWLKDADWEVSVISVDLFSTVDFDSTKQLWQAWVKDGESLFAIKGDSCSESSIAAVKNRLSDLGHTGVDWILIDGDHSYEGAKKDYDNYYPMLNNNGYCVFHDIIGQAGVSKLWQEVKVGKPVIHIQHSRHDLGIGVIQKWEK